MELDQFVANGFHQVVLPLLLLVWFGLFPATGWLAFTLQGGRLQHLPGWRIETDVPNLRQVHQKQVTRNVKVI